MMSVINEFRFRADEWWKRLSKRGTPLVLSAQQYFDQKFNDLLEEYQDIEVVMNKYMIDQFGRQYRVKTSDIVLLEDTSIESTIQDTYLKKKQFTILITGTVRCSMELKRSAAAACSVEIRINGTQVGTTITSTDDAYTEYTQDIPVSEGDLLQYWMRTTNAGDTAFLKNAEVRGTISLTTPDIGEVSI